MTKITYLLGAGASAKAIPTVKDMPNAMSEINSFILSDYRSHPDIGKEFSEKLLWLIRESHNHASVDTFAKKLFLTNNIEDLNKLKGILDVFFTLIQLKSKPDPRYDAFFAAIAKTGPENEIILPDNLNIISWNYDFQFELAAYNFYKTQEIKQIENKIGLIPNSDLNEFNSNKFQLIKLNGTASGIINNDKFFRNEFLSLTKSNHNSLIHEVLKKEYNKLTGYTSSILFAWENNPISIRIRELASERIENTDILVIIGYSFPTFNREIDRSILNRLGNIRKIVIQSLPESVESIEFRLKAILNRKISIERNTDKDEFFIPFEF